MGGSGVETGTVPHERSGRASVVSSGKKRLKETKQREPAGTQFQAGSCFRDFECLYEAIEKHLQ